MSTRARRKLRATVPAASLPRSGTSEGRHALLADTALVTERVIAAEAAAVGLTDDGAPTEDELLPDNSARLEIGGVAAAALAEPLARALFAHLTAGSKSPTPMWPTITSATHYASRRRTPGTVGAQRRSMHHRSMPFDR